MLDDIRNILLEWFEANKREFFWRKYHDPYIILITEILLKKTTADTINRFLPRFLHQYPDIQALYESNITEIQSVLEPIGLSTQRAVQLKNLAQTLVESYKGIIPTDKQELLNLPGIGHYTAGAILSFAYDLPEPIVDTNIARFVIRILNIEPSHYEARRSPEIWNKAKELIQQDIYKSKDINWALLDFAALVCKSRNPLHEECPLKNQCCFYKNRVMI